MDPFRFQDRRFCCLNAALPAGVGVVDILADRRRGRAQHEGAPDLFSNLLHHRAAGIADPFSFWYAVLHNLNGNALRAKPRPDRWNASAGYGQPQQWLRTLSHLWESTLPLR